jgi:hypothetical protein
VPASSRLKRIPKKKEAQKWRQEKLEGQPMFRGNMSAPNSGLKKAKHKVDFKSGWLATCSMLVSCLVCPFHSEDGCDISSKLQLTFTGLLCVASTFKSPPPCWLQEYNDSHLVSPITDSLLPFRQNTDCFKKSFTTLKAYINLFRGNVQCFELS